MGGFVIPAKAGIQQKTILMHRVHSLLVGLKNNVFAFAHSIFLSWIPAFAGMTTHQIEKYSTLPRFP
jgi:hypothetical protein